MTRAQRAAYWIGPALICLLVHWREFGSWFRSDDFEWLAVGLNRHGFGDYLAAIFHPMAQGTLRPLSDRLFFMAGFALFGLDALPFRFLIFATQIANILLVMWIGSRISGRRLAGFTAAILWIVNDTMVMPLGWASAYNQVLCAFFLLLAFHFLLRYIETGDSRFNLYQWVAFLMGFGAMELNVVYPALAAAYAALCAPKYLRRVWALFVPSIAYFAIHTVAAPAGRDPAYLLHFTGGMLRTLAKYWAWSVGPFGFWAPFALSRWVVPALVVLISAGLLGFALVRKRGALFCIAWFVIAIAPVLPLRDHVMDYYAFFPVIGLCWLGGWALAEARKPAIALVAVYLVIMVPRTLASAKWNDDITQRVRNLVQGVERAHELHPAQTILLDGVDTMLFYNGVLDQPGRLFGLPRLYITAESAKQIEAHAELADIGEFVLPAEVLTKALTADQIAVYDVRGPDLRNITSAYARQAHDAGLPLRLDVSSPLAAPLLGTGWYPPDDNHRWMGKRASLRMAAPKEAGKKLYLQAYYPLEQFAKGTLTVTVSVNGIALTPQTVPAAGSFELAYALPATVVGQGEIQVVVEVSRTFHAAGDQRELGLTFGEFEIR